MGLCAKFSFISNFLVGLVSAAVFTSVSAIAASSSSAATSTDFSTAKVAALLANLKKEQKACAKPASKRPSICHHEKFLLAMEDLMKSYLEQGAKLKRFEDKVVYLDNENGDLKIAMKSLEDKTENRNPASGTSTSASGAKTIGSGFGERQLDKSTCYKPELLHRLMLDNGISVNGGTIFSKLPLPGADGVCWSNSKKKEEATLTLCNMPLAISIRSKGGSDVSPVIREREYVFSLNKCDLLSVHIKDEDVKKKTETYLSYNECLEQWNKRTADAAMTPTQVKLMEDTIGVCFREHLLPPRNEKNGRDDPPRPMPGGSANSRSNTNSFAGNSETNTN